MARRSFRLLLVIWTLLVFSSLNTTSQVNAQDGNCSSAPASYLNPGTIAVVNSGSTIMFLKERADIYSANIVDIGPGVEVEILDGPVCNQGYRWWLVEKESGQAGWISDGDGGVPYFVVISSGTLPDIVDPPPAPDPVDNSCSDAPPNILSRNMTVMVPADQLPNNLRITRGEENRVVGQLAAGVRAVIVDGPECYKGRRWWNVHIESTGVTGWTQDGAGNERWLVPYEDQTWPTSCPGTPEDYLRTNIVAWVLPGNANNVRSGPGTANSILFELQANERFNILDGPVCVDGYRWWFISTLSWNQGWTADGTGRERWLGTNYETPVIQPAATNTPPPTPTPPTTFTPSPTFTASATFTPSHTPTRTPTRTPTPSPSPTPSLPARILDIRYDYYLAGMGFLIDMDIQGYANQTLDVFLYFKDGAGNTINRVSNLNNDDTDIFYGRTEITPCCDSTIFAYDNQQAVFVGTSYGVLAGATTVYPVVEVQTKQGEVIGYYDQDDGAPPVPIGNCPNDHDCDGLSDADETTIIEFFKPYIEFDEEEPSNINRDVSMIYQVSPGRSQDGRQGVWVTVAVLYRFDYGMTAFDISGVNRATCIGYVQAATYPTGLSSVAFAIPTLAEWGLEQSMSAHLGDSEAVRLFLRTESDGWYLDHLMMKRHYDGWEHVDLDEFEHIISDDTGYHVLIQASESKHAMYSEKDLCEDYSHDIEIPYIGDIPLLGNLTSCTINLEDCADDVDHDYWILNTPFEHNVGEYYAPYDPFGQPTLARDLLGSNNHAWSSDPFCPDRQGDTFAAPEITIGDTTISLEFEECAGSLRGKWLHPGAIFYSDQTLGNELLNAKWTRPFTRDLAKMFTTFPMLVEWAPAFARPTSAPRIG